MRGTFPAGCASATSGATTMPRTRARRSRILLSLIVLSPKPQGSGCAAWLGARGARGARQERVRRAPECAGVSPAWASWGDEQRIFNPRRTPNSREVNAERPACIRTVPELVPQVIPAAPAVPAPGPDGPEEGGGQGQR